MHPRDAAFFAAVFIAVLAVGLQLSAAQTPPGSTVVCSNSENEFTLTSASPQLTLAPAQLDPGCPITQIQAAVLGHVTGASAAQLEDSAVTMTYTPAAVTVTYLVADAKNNPEEVPVRIRKNAILIAGT